MGRYRGDHRDLGRANRYMAQARGFGLAIGFMVPFCVLGEPTAMVSFAATGETPIDITTPALLVSGRIEGLQRRPRYSKGNAAGGPGARGVDQGRDPFRP